MFGGVTPVPLGEMIPGRPGATGRMGASGDRETPVGDRCTRVGEAETPVDALPEGRT